MNQNQRARLDNLEQRITPAERPGTAIVSCGLDRPAWDELGEAERERLVAEQLGRPSRPDDFVIVLNRVERRDI